MTEDRRLQQMWQMAEGDFDDLDARVRKIVRRGNAGTAPRRVANALLRGFFAAAFSILRSGEDVGAASAAEYRKLLRATLTPEIRRRVARYKRRFPRSGDLFDRTEREAVDYFGDFLLPADRQTLIEAEAGRYEACYRNGQPVSPRYEGPWNGDVTSLPESPSSGDAPFFDVPYCLERHSSSS